MPDLPRTQILSRCPDPVLDVVPLKAQGRAVPIDTPKRDVNVRMLRIEVGGSHPFEGGTMLPNHVSKELTCQLLQVKPFSELWRYDHLPDAFVACLLPSVKDLSHMTVLAVLIETGFHRFRFG